MGRPSGLGVLIVNDPDRNGEVQQETFTCQHCMAVRPLGTAGAVCKKCMGFICQRPECHDNCTPIKARLY